jgi:hypothetical protein
MSCFSFIFYVFFSSIKIREQKGGTSPWGGGGSWYQWEVVGGVVEKGDRRMNMVQIMYMHVLNA